MTGLLPPLRRRRLRGRGHRPMRPEAQGGPPPRGDALSLLPGTSRHRAAASSSTDQTIAGLALPAIIATARPAASVAGQPPRDVPTVDS